MKLLACFPFFLVASACLAQGVTFRPSPERPDYASLPDAEVITAAIAYAKDTVKWNEDLSAWLEGLSGEEMSAWHEAREDSQESFGNLPLIPADYFWLEAGAFQGLSEQSLLRLKQDNLLIVDHPWKQSFEVYTTPPGPYFITSDSLLNAFHVLFERSLVSMERRRYEHVRSWLEKTWRMLDNKLPDDEAKLPLLREGKDHARVVLAVAMRLLDKDVKFINDNERKLVEEEVARVEAAEGIHLPTFLAPSTNDLLSIDYSRFKPVGIYTLSPELSRLFRAVKWLQTIPFRIDRDKELVAALLISKSAPDYSFPRGPERFMNRSSKGVFGFRSVSFFSAALDSDSELQKKLKRERDWLVKYPPSVSYTPAIDQLRLENKSSTSDSAQVRMLPSFLLKETEVWNLIRGDKRLLTEGLEVAAMLGSTLGKEELEARIPDAGSKLLVKVEADGQANNSGSAQEVMQPVFWPYSIYGRYMYALAALFAPADSDAPDLFSSRLWERKSMNTALASWAQMRHALTLVTQEDALYFGLVDLPPGFVEPNPEFYHRMADVERDIASVLFDAEAIGQAKAVPVQEPPDFWDIPRDEDTLARQWLALIDITRQLEALSHKQLRGQDWSKSETEFIRHYGEYIAYMMGYLGNSWEAPRDDSPRVAVVGSDPLAGTYQHVGIARARTLYVLYPWKGQYVLCSGAIMPYQVRTLPERLNDNEWLEYLDSNKIIFPDWIKPIVEDSQITR